MFKFPIRFWLYTMVLSYLIKWDIMIKSFISLYIFHSMNVQWSLKKMLVCEAWDKDVRNRCNTYRPFFLIHNITIHDIGKIQSGIRIFVICTFRMKNEWRHSYIWYCHYHTIRKAQYCPYSSIVLSLQCKITIWLYMFQFTLPNDITN